MRRWFRCLAMTASHYSQFSEDKPIAVLASGMVGDLPFGIDDRTLADLYDTVAGAEPNRTRCLDEIHVSPLVLVVVDVVADLTHQDAFGFQDVVGFPQERRISVGERISVLLGRS